MFRKGRDETRQVTVEEIKAIKRESGMTPVVLSHWPLSGDNLSKWACDWFTRRLMGCSGRTKISTSMATAAVQKLKERWQGREKMRLDCATFSEYLAWLPYRFC